MSSDGFCALCAPVRDPELPMPGPEWHPECGVRTAIGGIGHLTNHQFWCNEMNDPDAGLGYRASALMVMQWVNLHGLGAPDGDG